MATDQISKRYAQAWIGAAQDKSATASLKSDCAALQAMIAENAEFSAFLKSPVISKAEQKAVIAALSKKAKFDSITTNFLLTLADNRRLNYLPATLAAAHAMLAAQAGEVQALVTSATPLDAANVKDITSALTKKLGKDVSLETRVDENIIGGLVIRIGSTLIDDSVKTKLERLQRKLQAGAAA